MSNHQYPGAPQNPGPVPGAPPPAPPTYAAPPQPGYAPPAYPAPAAPPPNPAPPQPTYAAPPPQLGVALPRGVAPPPTYAAPPTAPPPVAGAQATNDILGAADGGGHKPRLPIGRHVVDILATLNPTFGNAGDAVIPEMKCVESNVSGCAGGEFGYFQGVDRGVYPEDSKSGGKVKAQKRFVAKLCLSSFGFRKEADAGAQAPEITKIAVDLWEQRGSAALNGRRVVANVSPNKNGYEELSFEPYTP